MSKRIFFDINIILDILTAREPHYAASAKVYSMVEKGVYEGFLSIMSLGTIYYILSNHFENSKAVELIKLIRNVLEIVDAPRKIANMAIDAEWDDFEDALQYYSALHCNADYIITRNISDFKKSEIPVYTPEEFIKLINNG